MNVCFVDCETTGLDPERHEIWEVALIVDEQDYTWQLPVDLGRADPMALSIGRFHQRRAKDTLAMTPGYGSPGHITPIYVFAREFANLTQGRHLVGAVVSFDAERLWKVLRAGNECPMWHYHVIDVEALAVGYLSGRLTGTARESGLMVPPWESSDLSAAVGVDPEKFEKHTALGDARWAKAIYEAVIGS